MGQGSKDEEVFSSTLAGTKGTKDHALCLGVPLADLNTSLFFSFAIATPACPCHEQTIQEASWRPTAPQDKGLWPRKQSSPYL